MDTKIFAFAGKGGVGKTSLSAALVRLLSQKYPDKKILAVDADPAVGLATALNIEETPTLDDIRKKIAESIDAGETRTTIELLSEAEFHLTDSLGEKENISFLAIGRPEAAGCYCKVNAYLKQVIETLAGNYDYVVIDGEAGIEQINRRVMENITYLLLVTDASKKGIQVAKTVKEVAEKLTSCQKAGIIYNRVPADFVPPDDIALPETLTVIGTDLSQAENDRLGESVFCLPAGSPLLKGIKEVLSCLEEVDENASV